MDAVTGVLSSLIGQTKPVDTITVSNKHPRLDTNRDVKVREPEAEPLAHLSNYLSGIIRNKAETNPKLGEQRDLSEFFEVCTLWQ